MLTQVRGVTTKPCRCPALPVRTLSILRQKGSDAAVTTVMGNDADPVLDDNDEDEGIRLSTCPMPWRPSALRRRCCRRHAKKGKTAPKLNTSEPDPSWSESEIELSEGDDEDDEVSRLPRRPLLPRRHAKRGQVTGQL